MRISRWIARERHARSVRCENRLAPRCGAEQILADIHDWICAHSCSTTATATRPTRTSKLRLNEMGSRYLFIVLHVWLEDHLSRGDYRRKDPPAVTLEERGEYVSTGGA